MSVGKARALRRAETRAERRLWSRLRDRRLGGHKFRRQHPIGPYVVDFLCTEKWLAVEVDGGQHAARGTSDQARTCWLEARGIRVVRFWNNEVLENPGGVCSRLLEMLRHQSTPSPRPSPPRGRGR